MTRLMKTILLPLILAVAYFGANAKTGDTVDRLVDQVLDRTGELLRGAGGKAGADRRQGLGVGGGSL